MKAYKSLLFAVLALAPLWTLAAQQKYALVIGNGAYTNITRLNNPVNDANDMATALESLGFQVDKVLNGSLDQMENAVIRLRNRLSTNAASYGFFFYAGHGVQSNGDNYLIPADANIAGESFLRQRAVQMQVVLDELNQAGNTLNIVVLDACRDNPFNWSRSGSRGLSVVGSQPADSIIVYATGSGQVAQDGTGRNGLFTEQLLKNIKTPGLSVRDIFDRTGADVARVSGRKQIPAIYSQFFGTAYLAGTAPVNPQPAPQPSPNPQPVPSTIVAYVNTDSLNVRFGPSADYGIITSLARNTRVEVISASGGWSSIRYSQNTTSNTGYVNSSYLSNNPVQPNPQTARTYYDRGVMFLNRGDNDTAIAEYTEAIRIDPNYAVAYNDRGLAYNNKGDYDRGIADCTQALRIDPNLANAYGNRGLAYINKGDNDRGIADCTQALRIDPNIANIYNNRGWAYINKGDNDRGIADCTQAIRIDPNLANAYNNRGWAYINKGDNDRGIADCTQAIRIDPNLANAYNNRGNAYYNKKDYDRAIADYTQALRIDPNHAIAKKNIEEARRLRGR
jgi:tetratricopeptide (TPR) repeat protein